MIALLFLLLTTVEFRVAKIATNGNQYFKEPAIRNIMLTRTPGIFRKGVFNQEIFKGDITAIKNLYKYEGFLEIEVDYELVFDSTDRKVEISIHIDEGNQTFIETIEFRGNVVFSDSILRTKIVAQLNEPFDKRKIELDSYVLTSVYDDIGYADAIVQTDYSIKDYKTQITHTITENERQYLQNIEFYGIKRTQEGILHKEIVFYKGDVFRYANVLKSQRNLYNLGIFKSVKTQIKNADEPNHKIAQFYLNEKKAVHFYFRIGYGTLDYLRLGAGVKHVNLLGRAWRGKVDGKWSFAEYRLNTQLTFPRFIMFPVKYSIGAFFQFKEEIGFKTRSIGGYMTTHFGVLQGTFSTKYEVERIRTYYPDYDSTEDDWLQGITLNWLKDQRDDPLFARTGNYVNILLETSGIIFPSDVDFVKPTFDYRLFRPLIFLVGAISVKIGLVQEITPTLEVPVYKRFYCGGTSSIRGYSEWAIGPKDEMDNPIGGKILTEISSEIRFPIYKILGGILFADGGNVWQEYSDFNGKLRYSIGAGLRLKTPLGSVRLDYGFKLGRQTGESPGVLHFAIGEAF